MYALLLFVVAGLLAAPGHAVQVDTAQGTLQGVEQDGVSTFRSVPYALPPTGVRRWRAPEPPASWRGVRRADAFSPQCVQSPYPEASMFTQPSLPHSEDCLYLNVWSANVGGETPAAVMVWIHGGALTRGSGASSIYDGRNLARKGVVLVTINYRLGAFGYLAHPALSAEAKAAGAKASSGNYGTLDQIAALRWVQENIAAFGGDPARVTIFGESAGAWSVNHLTASPLAAGLFARAIGQSGGKFDPMPELATDRPGQPAAQTLGLRFARQLGAADLAQLRALPAATVQAGFERFPVERFAQPNVDGHVFPDHIARIFERGEHNRVDLMVGSNADEGTNLMPPPKSPEQVAGLFETLAGPLAAQARAGYGGAQAWRESYYGFFRDLRFTWPMQQWATAAARAGDRTYLYYFTFAPPGPLDGRLGAYHAAEIRYVFDNAAITFDGQPATAQELALGDTLSSYWTSFARTGSPVAEGAPPWKPYGKRRGGYLELAAAPQARRGRPMQAQVALVGQLQQARWRRHSAAEPEAGE